MYKAEVKDDKNGVWSKEVVEKGDKGIKEGWKLTGGGLLWK